MDRRRRAFFAGACWLGLCGAALFAQEPMTPTLPPTTVEGAQPTAPTLPPTTVEGNQPGGPTDPFGPSGDPFDDFGDGGLTGDPAVDGFRFGSPIENGYSGTNSTTGSILALPDADVAGTVNVVNRNVLDDQQVLQFQDLVRNAGAVISSPNGTFGDQILVRGLLMQTRDYRKDGFLDPTLVPRDFQNVERVEILKGPASSMYGAASPAGLVNVITKKPLDASFANVGFTFGSFERQRYTVDANSRVTGDGAVLLRLNAAHEDTNLFRDFDYLSRTDINPVLRWNIDNVSSLTYSADWHRDYRRGDQGIPSVGDNPLGYPNQFYAGNPTETFGGGFFGVPPFVIPADNIRYEEFRQTLVYNHEISDDWTFNIGGSSLFYSYPGSITVPGSDQTGFGFGGAVPPGGLYYKQSSQIAAAEQSQSAIANLAGEFYTGSFLHKAVIGSEFVYFDSASSFALNQDLVPAGSFTGGPPYSPGGATLPLGTADFPAYRQTRFGAYVQDLMEITPEWKLVGGMRFDTINVNFDRTLPPFPLPIPPTDPSINQTYDRLTPRGGVIYQPWADESLACYFNFSQSFSPPAAGLYFSNGPQQPVTGDSFELGVKSMLMEGLTLNVAGFYMDRQNADIALQPFFLTQVGEERTKGVEMNLLGQMSERTSVVANYAYVDCRLFDNGAFQPVPINGNRQRNVPYNQANVWLRHNFIDDGVQIVGLGGGIVYQDARPVDLANTYNLPAFVRVDGGLFYTRGQLGANVYVENIGDVNYIAASQSTYQLFPGAPTNVRATVSWLY